MNLSNVNRRTILALACSTPLFSGCFYDRFFDLEWDEEVQLHDGRVIVVHIKHRYMRIEQGLTRYSGISIPIDSILTLDTGSSAGVVVQYFKGFHPIFLDQYEGIWYAALTGRYYPGVRETPGQNWGDLQGPSSHRVIHLVDSRWRHMNLCDFPEKFKTPNIIMPISEVKRMSAFDKQRVSLLQKHHHQIEYRLGPGHLEIERPQINTANACPSKPNTPMEISK
jgi:hypothetical protein